MTMTTISPHVKSIASWGLPAVAGIALMTAGLEQVTNEPKHEPGGSFSDLAKWELALGIGTAATGVVAAMSALGYLHYRGPMAEQTLTSTRLAAAAFGTAGGLLTGRVLNQGLISTPSVRVEAGDAAP